ncbi:MAG: hypothetical protein MGU50_09510 [Trichodesmium sp. MAG_R02]|nr:hypothetical protein [Trichodesmium sp. MAG_R02]
MHTISLSLATPLKKLILYLKYLGISIVLNITDKIISTNQKSENYKRSL